jgi:hypothetical protein
MFLSLSLFLSLFYLFFYLVLSLYSFSLALYVLNNSSIVYNLLIYNHTIQFERILESFIGSAASGEYDTLQGTSEAVMVGAKIPVGTGAPLELLVDKTKKPVLRRPKTVPLRPSSYRTSLKTTRSFNIIDRSISNVSDNIQAYKDRSTKISRQVESIRKCRKRPVAKSAIWHTEKRIRTTEIDTTNTRRSMTLFDDEIFIPSSPI